MTCLLITPSLPAPSVSPSHAAWPWAATVRYEASMRIIATPRVLGLQGLDMDRMCPVASAKDREGGASRPICQRTGSNQITATFPHHGPPAWPLAAIVR